MNDESECPICGSKYIDISRSFYCSNTKCHMSLYGLIPQAVREIQQALAAARADAAELVADAEKRGYEAAQMQAMGIALNYEYAPGLNIKERVQSIAERIRAMQPRPSEAGPR